MQIAATIAEMLDQSRKFNLIYIRKLDPARFEERLELDGIPMNSPLWIIGHLAWGEASLVLGIGGGKIPELPWLDQFAAGRPPVDTLEIPDFFEWLEQIAELHATCLDHIRSQSDIQLGTPAYIPVANWNTTRKKVFYHAIRHESTHTGQLAWIAKAHGGMTP